MLNCPNPPPTQYERIQRKDINIIPRTFRCDLVLQKNYLGVPKKNLPQTMAFPIDNDPVQATGCTLTGETSRCQPQAIR
jgi:hypothetical protein